MDKGILVLFVLWYIVKVVRKFIWLIVFDGYFKIVNKKVRIIYYILFIDNEDIICMIIWIFNFSELKCFFICNIF